MAVDVEEAGAVLLHVDDMAAASVHVMELDDATYRANTEPMLSHINVGTGRGHSVLDMVRAFETASGKPVPYRIVPRRPGDVAIYLADPARAAKRLGWSAQRDLDAMCRDAWAWQSYLAGRNS